MTTGEQNAGKPSDQAKITDQVSPRSGKVSAENLPDIDQPMASSYQENFCTHSDDPENGQDAMLAMKPNESIDQYKARLEEHKQKQKVEPLQLFDSKTGEVHYDARNFHKKPPVYDHNDQDHLAGGQATEAQGVKAIKRDGSTYLDGHVSNVPEVSQGVTNPVDAAKHLGGVARELGSMAAKAANHFAQSPEQLNKDVGQMMEHWSKDPHAVEADTLKGLQNVAETLDKPMSPEQRQKGSSEAMVWFIFGQKKPVSKEVAAESIGVTAEELEAMRLSDSLPKSVEYMPKNYRDLFYETHPELQAIKDTLEVHHKIPQQVLDNYPGMFSATEINSLDNLVGIPKKSRVHPEISKEWRRYIKDNPNATKQDVLQKAAEMDRKYLKHYRPRLEQ